MGTSVSYSVSMWVCVCVHVCVWNVDLWEVYNNIIIEDHATINFVPEII